MSVVREEELKFDFILPTLDSHYKNQICNTFLFSMRQIHLPHFKISTVWY